MSTECDEIFRETSQFIVLLICELFFLKLVYVWPKQKEYQ